MDQNKMPICDALKEFLSAGRISMHIPGHKGKGEALPELKSILGDSVMAGDLTEIAGFDDYHEPEGIILEAQKLAAELYGSDECFFLVNGTTSGLMAAVAAVAGEGKRIAVARDCHKSVARGMVLSGAEPVYIDPEIDSETGLACGISLSKLEQLLMHSGVKAVVLTHPSYYGTYSDIRAIVKLAHKFGAAVIADEAHGAHLRFAEQDEIPDAMSAGADISVQSIHKMHGSLTQSSMLHVKGSIIDRKRLAYFIRMLTSTSPSYILMASLDAARHRMAASGHECWKGLITMIDEYADRIAKIPGISCIRGFTAPDGAKKPLDGGRLLVTAENCGYSGYELSDILFEKYKIDCEFSDDRYVLAVAGPGSESAELDAFVEALVKISKSRPKKNVFRDKDCLSAAAVAVKIKHEYEMTPRQAVMSACEEIELKYGEGRTSAADVSVYPPGIPLITAGERITSEIISIIEEMVVRGIHVHGLTIKEDTYAKRIMLTVTEDAARAMLFDCIF